MLRVRIGFDPDYFLGRHPSPLLPPTDLPALVDTGATYSAIDSALGTYLGLPRVGTTRVSGAHGSGELPLYAAQVYVIDLDYTLTGRFAGAHLSTGNQTCLAVLGRSFLRDFTMVYEGHSGRVLIHSAPT
jgi:hypothetical protein